MVIDYKNGTTKRVVFNQNPSKAGSQFDKKVTYKDTIDGGLIRISPLLDARDGLSIEWTACNAELRELLREVAKKDYKIRIVSHHGKDKITMLGDSTVKSIGLTGWSGYFDEYSENERTELQTLYYEIAVRMNNVTELNQSEIDNIVNPPS